METFCWNSKRLLLDNRETLNSPINMPIPRLSWRQRYISWRPLKFPLARTHWPLSISNQIGHRLRHLVFEGSCLRYVSSLERYIFSLIVSKSWCSLWYSWWNRMAQCLCSWCWWYAARTSTNLCSTNLTYSSSTSSRPT